MKTQITLTQDEIKSAIRTYVETEGIVLDGMDVDITINAVRSPTGFTATVDLEKAGSKKAKARRANKVTPAVRAPVVEADPLQANLDKPSEIQEVEGTATDVGEDDVLEGDAAEQAEINEALKSTAEEDAADDAEEEEVDPQVAPKKEVKKVGAAKVSIFDTDPADDAAEAKEAVVEKAAAPAKSSSSLFDN